MRILFLGDVVGQSGCNAIKLNLQKIIKIGLAFSFQKIKKLPINKFDKKLDAVITEEKLK